MKRLHVVEVLEEVISGESMHAHPEMMRLLDLISTGMYAGVVCMDIERLSRGSSMDSGYIMQVLQVNNCKIITPGKIYDLRNDSDEQFTDMKFMFSWYELKSINTRLERGRNQSASEGKFMGSMAPYGYRPFHLAGEKGNSLGIEPEEAKVVQDTICGYLEKGIYTIEMFQKRNASLSKEIARLQETEEKLLRKRESGDQANQAALDIIPTTQHILDNYDALTTEEKNRLWKLVLRKVTAYRTPDGKLSVHIYPKLPKAI